MTEKTKVLKLKCIRSQVFDTYGELVLRVPADASTEEIRELVGEEAYEWQRVPWNQLSERQLSDRANDPRYIDVPAVTEVSEENTEPHGRVIRSDDGLQIRWLQ